MSVDPPSETRPPAVPDAVHVFVDTNVLLHGRALDELPIHSLLGVPPTEVVTVVITRTVLAELDGQKVKNPNKGLRDRAGKRTRELWERERTKNWKLRNGAQLALETRPHGLDLPAIGLDGTITDDIILAEVIRAKRDEPWRRIFVLSGDSGVLVKASRLGIAVVELTLENRLEVPDAHDRRIRELAAENERLKNRLPRLAVAFAERAVFLKAEIVRPRSLDPKEVEKRVEQRAADFPAITVTPPEGPFGIAGAASIFALQHEVLGPSERDATNFNQKREDWLRQVRAYYETAWLADDELFARTLVFDLILVNAGSATGTDIRVELGFPKGVTADVGAPVPKGLPRRPERPRSAFESLSTALVGPELAASVERFHAASGSPPNIGGPWMDSEDDGTVTATFRIAKARHQSALALPRLFVLLPPFDTLGSFNVTVSVIAAELADWSMSTLNVEVLVRDSSSNA